MARFDSQALPFVVRVLEGPLAGREIRLEGRSLPYAPIAYEGRQRVKTTWYPGNPVATQQVLGPTEEPTLINGTWKDRFLGNGEARRLAGLFDSLRRAGVLLEVEWGMGVDPDSGQTIGEAFVRQGIITRTKFSPQRPQDVGFEVEFTWRGQPGPTAPPLTALGIANPREGFQETADSLQDTLDRVQEFLLSPVITLSGIPADVEQTLDEASASLRNMIGAVNSATESITSLAELPSSVIESVAGALDQAFSSMEQMAVTLEGLWLGLLEAKDDALTLLDLQGEVIGTAQQARRSQADAARAREELFQRMLPEVVAEVRAPAGTDLRDLAQEFYGDPDLWWLIANFNGLDTSRVPSAPTGPSDDPANPIRIPRRTPEAVGDLRRQGC